MNTFINKVKEVSLHSDSLALKCLHVVLGSFFIALMSQIEIPIQPIPFTLQTFALFLMALALGSQKAFYATCLYLVEATIGFPVLAGGLSCPLWFLMPFAGYCFSFPIAAYIIGKASSGVLSNLKLLGYMAIGQGIIYAMGAAWLSVFVGLEGAFQWGVYPFVSFDLLKIAGAFTAYMAYFKLCKE